MNELHFILILKPFSEPKVHVSKDNHNAWTDYDVAKKEAEKLQKSLRKTKKEKIPPTHDSTFIHIAEQQACLKV